MGCAPSSNANQSGVIRRRSSAEAEGLADGEVTSLDPPRTALPDVANHKPKDGPESDIRWTDGAEDTGQSQERKASGRRNSCLKLGTMRIPHEPIKILLSFPREDAQSNAWTWAARKLGHTSAVFRTQDAAIQDFTTNQHQLIVVDRRHSNRIADADQLVRCIRATPGGRHAVIIAVVKRSSLEKEESSVQALLEIGYDRCYPESGSLGACLNELTTLVCGEISSRRRLKAAEAVISVLEMSRELVTITDQNHIVQYINPAYERILGYSMQDLANQNIVELLKVDGAKHDIADATVQAQKKGREWEGTMFCRRKTGDSVPLFTRVISLNVDGIPDKPEHIVMLQEAPPLLTDKFTSSELGGDLYPLARGSLRSIRKPSYDVRSLGSEVGAVLRRQSLARLHSLAIEAPITKVINILAATQESSPAHVAQALDKVIDILRSAELYSPPLFDTKGKSDDPVATDLLAALLLQGPRSSNAGIRRSSNESAVRITPTALARPLLPSGANLAVPIQLRDLLETDSEWSFDVLKLEKLTGRRPLVWLGLTTMSRFDVPRTLGCDESTLQNWLALIESHYHSSNPYHNSTHAADVLQATAYFLVRPKIKELLDPLEQAAALIAAVAHDVDHPGRTSTFLCNASTELAVLYNDTSVLESHHAALTFKLTLSDDRVNIFKGLDSETYKEIRKIVIDMILATEMTKHFEHLAKFVNVFTKPVTKEDEYNIDDLNMTNMSTPENIILVRRMLIKCADISNQLRPLKICVEWTRRITEEYFAQTDDEKVKELPLVMPQFERATCSIPKSQIGFIDYFLNDMIDAWDAFIDIPEIIGHLKTNYTFWREQEAKGSKGLPTDFSYSSSEESSRSQENRIDEKDENAQELL